MNKIISIGLPILFLAACSSSNNDGPARSNQAPAITPIGDQTISANITSMPIPVSVSDEAVGQLTFQVLSDNPDVVPIDGLVITGNSNPFLLTATPTGDVTGDTLVTVITTDNGGLSASATFLLTVAPQQLSLQQFTRDTFAADENSDPVAINAIEFQADADNDDFSDLLQ